jgi:hypothetical protein
MKRTRAEVIEFLSEHIADFEINYGDENRREWVERLNCIVAEQIDFPSCIFEAYKEDDNRPKDGIITVYFCDPKGKNPKNMHCLYMS